jgi:hypothetical protein
MKVEILHDTAEGTVIGVLYHSRDSANAEAPRAFLIPEPGQNVTILDVPPELEHLSHAQLHKALAGRLDPVNRAGDSAPGRSAPGK